MINKLLGLFLLAGSLAVVYLFETSTQTSGAFRIFHWPAIVLTAIGPLGVVLLCSDRFILRATFVFLRGRSASRQRETNLREASLLRRLGQDFYARGPKALESDPEITKASEPVRRMIERLAIRMPAQDVLELLSRERDMIDAKMSQSINLLNIGVRMCPSIGMLGTILGMTQLLASLTDPSHIGSHMSLALLTTFYGLFFSVVFWSPLANHMERIQEASHQGFEQAVHWLELLDQRKPAQYFAGLGDGEAPAPRAPREPYAGEPRFNVRPG